jgi:hypothetical protein
VTVPLMVMVHVLVAMIVVAHSLRILPRPAPPVAHLPLAMQHLRCWMVDNTPA